MGDLVRAGADRRRRFGNRSNQRTQARHRIVEIGLHRAVAGGEIGLYRSGEIAVRQFRQVRGHRFDDHALSGFRLRRFGFRGLFGDGCIAKHQHRSRHVAKFVAPLDVGNGDVDPAFREIGHCPGDGGDRTGDGAAEQDCERHGDADQRQPADDQRVACGSDRTVLTGGIFFDQLDRCIAHIPQRQHRGADEDGLAGAADRCLGLGALPCLDPCDQRIAPFLAPGQRFLA